MTPRDARQGVDALRDLVAKQSFGVRLYIGPQDYTFSGDTAVSVGPVEWRSVDEDDAVVERQDDGGAAFTFRDDLIVRFQPYPDAATALEAERSCEAEPGLSTVALNRVRRSSARPKPAADRTLTYGFGGLRPVPSGRGGGVGCPAQRARAAPIRAKQEHHSAAATLSLLVRGGSVTGWSGEFRNRHTALLNVEEVSDGDIRVHPANRQLMTGCSR